MPRGRWQTTGSSGSGGGGSVRGSWGRGGRRRRGRVSTRALGRITTNRSIAICSGGIRGTSGGWRSSGGATATRAQPAGRMVAGTSRGASMGKGAHASTTRQGRGSRHLLQEFSCGQGASLVTRLRLPRPRTGHLPLQHTNKTRLSIRRGPSRRGVMFLPRRVRESRVHSSSASLRVTSLAARFARDLPLPHIRDSHDARCAKRDSTRARDLDKVETLHCPK